MSQMTGSWSSEPDAPDRVHSGVGDGGGSNAAAGAPGAAVEHAGDGGQQHVAPVEGRRLVEVRQAEDDGGHEQGAAASEARLEQVLEQAAEEQFLGDGDE